MLILGLITLGMLLGFILSLVQTFTGDTKNLVADTLLYVVNFSRSMSQYYTFKLVCLQHDLAQIRLDSLQSLHKYVK